MSRRRETSFLDGVVTILVVAFVAMLILAVLAG